MGKNKIFNILKFLGIVLIFVTLALIISIWIWISMAKEATYVPQPSNPIGEYGEVTLIDIPRHTNVFVAGVDAETATLTDFMVVGTYDSETSEIDFISIPRDTDTVLGAEQRQEVEAAGIRVPKSIKLNELHSYTKKLGMDFLTEYMEYLLGIDIDYYVLVDLNVLHDLVDAMGGVYFDVPQRMKYTDKSQGLYIDLQPGYQLLDADQCEQLLRYRHGYAMGDIKRIEVQQDFLEAMMEQLFSLDTFLSNPTDFILTVFKNVETNVKPTDVAKYIQEIPKIKAENITFQTAPIASISGHVYLDEEELATLVDEIFYDILPPVEEVPTDGTGETTSEGGNAESTQ